MSGGDSYVVLRTDELRELTFSFDGRSRLEALIVAASAPALAGADGYGLSLNVKHPDCHKAADAFWKYWNENGETHKHGYYESTWGAINRAIRLVGVVSYAYGFLPKEES